MICSSIRIFTSFLSTPSARRATLRRVPASHSGHISIHALREEGDPISPQVRWVAFYFYPRPPRGGRRAKPTRTAPPTYFYPRPPRGGRPATSWRRDSQSYFYPRPPRGGRPKEITAEILAIGISIHALREEGDLTKDGVIAAVKISIHALREEGDLQRRGRRAGRYAISIRRKIGRASCRERV